MPDSSSLPLLAVLIFSLASMAEGQVIPFGSEAPPTTAAPSHAPSAGPSASTIRLEDRIAQMSQLDLQAVMLPARTTQQAEKLNISLTTQEKEWLDGIGAGYGWINETLVATLIQNRKVGSFFNSPSSADGHPVPPLDWWRRMQQRLFDLSISYGAKAPILFGLDTVHGADYIYNATLFPQQIGMASTFNTTVAHDAGLVGGVESRAAGIPWAFSPILGIAVQPSWARVYETFGEDPLVASRMGVAIIKALQSAPDNSTFPGATFRHNVAACAKHYIGYPNVRTGHDRTPVWTPMNLLMQYFAPSFEAAIKEAGVLSIMENYIEFNGRPVVGSNLILQFLLRDVMRFQGMLVTDYNEIYNQYDFHKSVGSYADAVYQSFNQTSIDMGMIGWLGRGFPDLATAIKQKVEEGLLDDSRIEGSAFRVLNLKRQLGLLDPVVDMPRSPVPPEVAGVCFFGCESHHAKALDATRQSVILLQNSGGFLPQHFAIHKGMKVGVIGQACDSVPLMAGGWTVHWQGTSNKSAFGYGSTIVDELRKRGLDVRFSEACNVTENSVCGEEHLSSALDIARWASVVVACIGERHYAEKPGDIDDLTLPGGQIGMMQQVAAINDNIVAVLIEGRPRILGPIPSLVKAVIHGWLPGPYGGKAIVEIISGERNPSGRLPITYPKTVNNAPIQYFRKWSANTGDDYDVQWQFGHGLSYSRFEYSNHAAMFIYAVGVFQANVTVTNKGPAPGIDTLFLFSSQRYRSFTPEVQMLRDFKRIELDVGETTTVQLSFLITDLRYINEYMCELVDTSPVEMMFAGYNRSVNMELRQTVLKPNPPLCLKWGGHFANQAGINTLNVPPSPPKVESHTQDYFISSIVCFGAGIIGTVIIVSLLRRRRSPSGPQNLDILEPNGL